MKKTANPVRYFFFLGAGSAPLHIKLAVTLILPLSLLFLFFGCDDQPPLPANPIAFAVLTDVHYAKKAPRSNRYYANSLEKLKRCVNQLNTHKLIFAIQLGDLIDGRNYPTELDHEQDIDEINETVTLLNQLNTGKHHVIGNHCRRLGHENLHRIFKLPRFYYDFTHDAAPGWRFVVLDATDPPGGIQKHQLLWLAETLQRADKAGEKVICFCHYPLLSEASSKRRRMRNPQTVLEILESTKCVKAWFAGHDHDGGFAEKNGIYHVTLKGMAETKTDGAWALVILDVKALHKIGFEREPNAYMPFSEMTLSQ